MSVGIDVFWIPLGAGAGGGLVRWSGRAYETLVAAVERRDRQALYHSALEVHLDGVTTVVEMAPVWITRGDRGVVAEGAVGARVLGRARLFRYEVRCWAGGTIPDAGAAVGGPRRVTTDAEVARAVLDLVPTFPTHTWGRDEQRLGEMWNSNSLTSWLLARTGVVDERIGPPANGRAPGWDAGLRAAIA